MTDQLTTVAEELKREERAESPHVVFLRRSEDGRTKFVGDSTTLSAADAATVAAAMAPWRDGNINQQRVMGLFGQPPFAGGLVIWADAPAELDSITPLQAALEPTELREEDPEICNLAGFSAPVPSQTSTSHHGIQQTVARLKLRMGVTWIGIFWLAYHIFTQWQRLNTRSWIGLILIAILFIMVLGAISNLWGRRFWRVVQGGVLIEPANVARFMQPPQLFVQQDAPLVIRKQESGYSASLWRDNGRETTTVTLTEAIALVAAWTSPVPPPSRELIGRL